MTNVQVNCPECGLPLPPLPVALEQPPLHAIGAPLTVIVRADVDDPAWRRRAKAAHPRCFGGRDDRPIGVAA